MLQWMFFEQRLPNSHEPYVAVARYWLAYAAKEDLEKKFLSFPNGMPRAMRRWR